MTIDLFSKLQPLYEQILPKLVAGESVMLRAGQRGGKTVLAQTLARSLWALNTGKPILHFAPTVRQSELNFALPGLPVRHYGAGSKLTHQLLYHPNEVELEPIALAVIDEAAWMERGENLFHALTSRGIPTFAISSSGPLWPMDEAQFKYATWDLNPVIDPLSSYFMRKAHEDFGKFARDFGLHDSHDAQVRQFYILFGEIAAR